MCVAHAMCLTDFLGEFGDLGGQLVQGEMIYVMD
jgi:hypothetical protein